MGSKAASRVLLALVALALLATAGAAQVLAKTPSVPPLSIALAVSPASTNVPAGAAVTLGVTVSRVRVTAPIALTVTGLSVYATATFTTVTPSAASLKLTTSTRTPLGSYALTIRGKAGAVTATTIAGTTRSGCTSATNFTTTQYSGSYPLTIPAHATRTLSQLGISRAHWPKLTMKNLPANQDGCKNTGLTLRFAGTGSGL